MKTTRHLNPTMRTKQLVLAVLILLFLLLLGTLAILAEDGVAQTLQAREVQGPQTEACSIEEHAQMSESLSAPDYNVCQPYYVSLKDCEGNNLAGAKLRVISDFGAYDEWETTADEDAHRVEGWMDCDLDLTLYEIQAPEGYQTAAPIRFHYNAYEGISIDGKSLPEDTLIMHNDLLENMLSAHNNSQVFTHYSSNSPFCRFL